MRTKLILTLTLFGLAGLPHAADDKAATKPQAGSATTKEQSAAHPATEGAAATESKAGAATTEELTTKHPAAKSGASSKSTPSATGTDEVRDWTAIDADRDSSISPDEMQKFLDKTWATKQKTS